MRTFRDPEGRFIIRLPSFWEYIKGENQSLSQFVSKDNPESCFQISFFNKNKGSISDVPKFGNFVSNDYYSEIDFSQREVVADKMRMVIREAVVGDHFVLMAYIADANQDNSDIVLTEIERMDASLKSLRVAKETHWQVHMIDAKFNDFMVALLASIDLSNKAMNNGSHVELVILLANQIDALLRIALILKNQLKNDNEEIDISLIFQGEFDVPIFEKKIYQLAYQQKIIDKSILSKLQQMYLTRNKVAHRYIISDLKTNDIVYLVAEYMDMRDEISEIVKLFEREQFERGVGIYGNVNPFNPVPEEDMPGLLAQLHEKHDNRLIVEESTIK